MRPLHQLGLPFPVKQIALWLGVLASSAAVAQSPGNLAAERQIDDAFRQVLEAPGDMGRVTRYAQLLVQAGNYEGGVAALEQLLLRPDAPATVRLELAVLYYRMASYAMAENLLRASLDDTRLVGEQRTLAESLLRDVVKRNQTSRLDGFAILGVRAQTNPNSRTDQDQVLAAGSLVPVDRNYQPRSDTDVQLTVRLDHEYDFDTQNEARLASSLVAQVVKFSSSSGSDLQPNQVAPYNLALAEVTSGIRFRPVQDAGSGLRLRPHLIASTLSAQGRRYLSAAGAGLDVDYRLNERTLVEAGYEYRRFSYATRIDVPDADALGGPQSLGRVRLSRELGPGRVVSGELRARFQRTDRAYYDHDAYEARLSYSAAYANPLPQGQGTWTTTVWSGVQRRVYDAPDPAVDALSKRRDTDWRLGVGNTMPLTDAWSVLVQLEHAKTRSSLPNYRYKNTSLLLALSYRL